LHYLLDFSAFADDQWVRFGEAVEFGHGGAAAVWTRVVEIMTR